jgi:protocatechuate 3,4-dioxygenase beta subunit
MLRLSLLFLCPFLAHAALHGTVTDAITGEPLSQVEIIVTTGAGPQAHSHKAVSDEHGRYRLPTTAQGQFYATPIKHGYKELRLMDVGSTMGFPTSLAGDNTLDFHLVEYCTIGGRVLDVDGNPVPFARIVLPTLGQRRHQVSFAPYFPLGVTASDGTYLLSALMPGQYYIAAVPNVRRPEDADPRDRTFAPVYNPGVADSAKAQRVSLKPGESRTIDFVVSTPTGKPVDGEVAGIPEGWPKTGVSVALVPAAGDLQNLQTVGIDANGKLRFDSVPPGSYTVLASARSWSPSTPRPANAATRHGRLLLTTDGSHDSRIIIQLKPTTTLRGRVTFANNEKPDPFCLLIGVHIESIDDVLPGSGCGAPNPDGTFECEHLPAGRYRISGVSGACTPIEPEQIVLFDAPEASVPSVITAKLPSILGVAPPGAFIVLAYKFSSGELDLAHVTTTYTDAAGNFHLDKLASGEWQIMALPSHRNIQLQATLVLARSQLSNHRREA